MAKPETPRGAIVSATELEPYSGRARILGDPEKIKEGIDGRFSIPYAQDVIDWWKNRGKGSKGGKGPGPFPEPGAKLAYHMDMPETGVIPYRWQSHGTEEAQQEQIARLAYHMACDDYGKPIEIDDFNEMQYLARRELGPGVDAAAFENGKNTYVLTRTKEGTQMPYYKMLEALLHENFGLEYTSRGESHEANHPTIERKTEVEAMEYLSKATAAHRQWYATVAGRN